MLQDLPFGKLDNAYHNPTPETEDVVVCFCNGQVLIQRHADDTLQLPVYGQVRQWIWQSCKCRRIVFIQCRRGYGYHEVL